jgi:endonuclease/exonuclease/phosphatase family metal-dependent hydrolase
MKPLLSFLIITIFSFSAKAQQELNVMTFNIRLNLASDSLNAWQYRKDKAVSQILFHDADLVGVQEAVPGQMDDLSAALKDYKYIGVGREDGKRKGEFSAIFYNTKRLSVSKSGTFWLSQTPEVPGKGWDAACERVVTWGIFTDKKTKKRFFHFNTHFDHMGQEARRQSAILLLKKVEEIAGNNPVLVTGDFNAEPADEPIRIITDKNNPLHLIDAEFLSETPHYGPYASFTGWQIKDATDKHIDYIFTKKKVRVLKHATLSEIWGTRFSSDHFPVLATLIVE